MKNFYQWPLALCLALVSPFAVRADEEAENRMELFQLYANCMHKKAELKDLEAKGTTVDWTLWEITYDQVDEDDKVEAKVLSCKELDSKEAVTDSERALFDELLADDSCIDSSGPDKEKLEKEAEQGEEECPECSPEEKKKSELGNPDCMKSINCAMIDGAQLLAPPIGVAAVQLYKHLKTDNSCGNEPSCLMKALNGALKSLWDSLYVFYDVPAKIVGAIDSAAKYVDEHGIVKSAQDVDQKITETQDTVASFGVYMARKRGEQILNVGESLGINEQIRKAQAAVSDLEDGLRRGMDREVRLLSATLQSQIDRTKAELDSLSDFGIDVAVEATPGSSLVPDFIKERAKATAKALKQRLSNELRDQQNALLTRMTEGQIAMTKQLAAKRDELNALIAKQVADAKKTFAPVISKAEDRIRRINEMSKKLDDSGIFEMLTDPAKFLTEMGPMLLDTVWQLAAMEFGCADPGNGIKLEGISPCKKELPGWGCATCSQKSAVFCQIGGFVTTEVTIAVVTAILTLGTATAVKYGTQGTMKILQLLGKSGKIGSIIGRIAATAPKLKKAFKVARKMGTAVYNLYRRGKGKWLRARVKVSKYLKSRPYLGNVLRKAQKAEDRAADIAKKLRIVDKKVPPGTARRQLRRWLARRAVPAGIIGFLLHQKYVTPEPEETLNSTDANPSLLNSGKRPEELPKMPWIEALEDIEGLGYLGSLGGTQLLEELAALGPKDHVVFSLANPAAAEQYLSSEMPSDIKEHPSLKNSPPMRALEKLFAKKDVKTQRARVTIIDNDALTKVPTGMGDRVKVITDGEATAEGSEVTIPFEKPGGEIDETRVKLVVDIGGAFDRAENPTTILQKYFRALTPDGSIILSSGALERKIKLSKTEEITLRQLLTRMKTVSFTNIRIDGSPMQPIKIEIRKEFRAEDKRDQVIESLAVAAELPR